MNVKLDLELRMLRSKKVINLLNFPKNMEGYYASNSCLYKIVNYIGYNNFCRMEFFKIKLKWIKLYPCSQER